MELIPLPDWEGKSPEDGPGSGLLFSCFLGVQPTTFGVFTVSLADLYIPSLLHHFIPLFHSVSSDRSTSPRVFLHSDGNPVACVLIILQFQISPFPFQSCIVTGLPCLTPG